MTKNGGLKGDEEGASFGVLLKRAEGSPHPEVRRDGATATSFIIVDRVF